MFKIWNISNKFEYLSFKVKRIPIQYFYHLLRFILNWKYEVYLIWSEQIFRKSSEYDWYKETSSCATRGKRGERAIVSWSAPVVGKERVGSGGALERPRTTSKWGLGLLALRHVRGKAAPCRFTNTQTSLCHVAH